MTVTERRPRGWSQTDLGERAAPPQAHISAMKNCKVIPRFDTLLYLVRILSHDRILTPRTLVPAVQALLRDNAQPMAAKRGRRRETDVW
jgi:predicted transcriptional regulator